VRQGRHLLIPQLYEQLPVTPAQRVALPDRADAGDAKGRCVEKNRGIGAGAGSEAGAEADAGGSGRGVTQGEFQFACLKSSKEVKPRLGSQAGTPTSTHKECTPLKPPYA